MSKNITDTLPPSLVPDDLALHGKCFLQCFILDSCPYAGSLLEWNSPPFSLAVRKHMLKRGQFVHTFYFKATSEGGNGIATRLPWPFYLTSYCVQVLLICIFVGSRKTRAQGQHHTEKNPSKNTVEEFFVFVCLEDDFLN